MRNTQERNSNQKIFFLILNLKSYWWWTFPSNIITGITRERKWKIWVFDTRKGFKFLPKMSQSLKAKRVKISSYLTVTQFGYDSLACLRYYLKMRVDKAFNPRRSFLLSQEEIIRKKFLLRFDAIRLSIELKHKWMSEHILTDTHTC